MKQAGLIAMVVIGGLALVFILLAINSGGQQQVTKEQQRTEQIRLAEQTKQMSEQTKQEGQQLRAEETNRVTNYLFATLAPIVGALVVLGGIAFVVVVSDNKMTRNRLWEERQLAILRQQQLQDEQRYILTVAPRSTLAERQIKRLAPAEERNYLSYEEDRD